MNTLLYNGIISTSSNASTGTWTSDTINASGVTLYPGSYTDTAGLNDITSPARGIIDIKRCRNCSHAHLAEQPGCIDQEGWNTIYVVCPCKEYLPKDNLEYLEYLDKKRR